MRKNDTVVEETKADSQEFLQGLTILLVSAEKGVNTESAV